MIPMSPKIWIKNDGQKFTMPDPQTSWLWGERITLIKILKIWVEGQDIEKVQRRDGDVYDRTVDKVEGSTGLRDGKRNLG